MEEILGNIMMTSGLFILIYGIYFVSTGVQFNRNINGL